MEAPPIDIPGMHGGMFFQCYLLSPLTNFTEEDLAALAKYITIVFEDEGSIPETAKEHFDGPRFAPTDSLTASQFADILDATNITITTPEARAKIPEVLKEHFEEDGTFRPFEDFGLEEIKVLISEVLPLRLDHEQFEPLSKHLKRQFMVWMRDGTLYRWGSRR